jgi:NAD dependent epimerase/dehydratase
MTLKGKKILVTGADGFIGSHLTEMLVSMGADVRALALYNSFNSWGWLEHTKILKDIEVITGDIRDPFLCQKITKEVDVVFHLAALIAIPFSYAAPQSYIETNINGTLNICQAALTSGVTRVLSTSTSEVYGTAKYVPINEQHPLQPQSPYSATKISADSMAMSYYNAFSLPVVIARPFNTYGPRQSARAVIPTIISQIASGNEKIKLGDLKPTRDLNFIDDTCRGLVQLMECDKAVGQTINVGSGSEISIGDLFNLIRDLMGSKVEVEADDQRMRPEKSEVYRLVSDISKIKTLVGYEPKVQLKDGLRKTIEWFTDPQNLKQYKPDIYNL